MNTIVYRKKWDAQFAYNESHPDTVYSNGKMRTMVNLPPITVGNISGRDVVLRIDKTTRQVRMGLTQ